MIAAMSLRRMVAIDLESSNGTMVERWAGTEFHEPRPLTPNKETFLCSKDLLILAGAAVSIVVALFDFGLGQAERTK